MKAVDKLFKFKMGQIVSAIGAISDPEKWLVGDLEPINYGSQRDFCNNAPAALRTSTYVGEYRGTELFLRT